LNAGERLKALYPHCLEVLQRAFELRYGESGDGEEVLDGLRRERSGAPDRLETVRKDFLISTGR